MSEKFVFQDHYDLDWEDIENKVQIISRRFNNIDYKYREDLEQELRLFAFTTSAHYSHLYRKAIDYWRHLSRKVYPEVCVFDVEDGEGNKLLVPEEAYEEKYQDESYKDLLQKVRKELRCYAQTKREEDRIEICERILEILEKDALGIPDDSLVEVSVAKWKKGRISISWITDQTGYKYREVQEAMRILSEIVIGLYEMGRIDQETAEKYIG